MCCNYKSLDAVSQDSVEDVVMKSQLEGHHNKTKKIVLINFQNFKGDLVVPIVTRLPFP